MQVRANSEWPTLWLIVFLLTIVFSFIGGWCTHVIVCIQDERWLFLIAGALAWPIGVVHGIGYWFGVW